MNSIKNQFVPYELAVKLKELGFDEECFGYYVDGSEMLKKGHFYFSENSYCKNSSKWNYNITAYAAPLFSQAFDWFRVEHNHQSAIMKVEGKYIFQIIINEYWNTFNNHPTRFTTYESARLACLEKLIELVTEKNK